MLYNEALMRQNIEPILIKLNKKKETFLKTPTKSVKSNSSSWNHVSAWYQNLVELTGHFYHQKVIFPKLAPLWNWENYAEPVLVDFACGEGVLSRVIPEHVFYYGIDIAPEFIEYAKTHNQHPNAQFSVGDVTKPISLSSSLATHVTLILALQNIADPLPLFHNVFRLLAPQGRFFMVIMHPCFRPIRYSSWQVDPEKEIRYRRVDRYLTSYQVDVKINPSKKEKSATTPCFHYSLETIFHSLKKAGLIIEDLHEWSCPKKSTGKFAKTEDFSRRQIPLFLCLTAKK